VKDYRVVWSNGSSDFEAKVKALLVDGWQLQGGMATGVNGAFWQALTKSERGRPKEKK